MNKRKLSWIVTVCLLINIITGIQVAIPQGANAEEIADSQAALLAPGSADDAQALVGTTTAALEWKTAIFGSSTNLTDNTITVNENGSIAIASLNGKGKISGKVDGIAFYYAQLENATPFQITADVNVDTFVSGDNQVSFGLMLRKSIGTNGSSSGHVSNFVAVGADNQKMQAFYRSNESAGTPAVTASDLIPVIPSAGNKYTLRLIATSNNKCIVSCGANTAVIDTAGMFDGGQFNIGLFAARNAKVTFSNVNIVTNATGITLSGPPAKTKYFQGDDLDLTGMTVTAAYSDDTTKVLSSGEYTLTGYDKNLVGTQTVTVNYAGRSAAFTVEVAALILTGINMVYTPAKTTYYLNDSFDPLGMVINASYSSGAVKTLGTSEYTLSGFDSTTAGQKTVTATAVSDPAIKTSFDITVRPSVLQSLQITRQPAKTTYYLGESLNLDGLVVTAVYDDSGAMLQSGEYTTNASGFDTASAGQKTVVISHKGKSVNLDLTVKSRALTGISVTTLPKTTFYTGENFDSTGIVVSRVYDSGDREALASGDYTINSSSFDKNTPGTHEIVINPLDPGIPSTSYKVTVRQQKTYEWNTVVFGQSVSASRNFVTPSAVGTVDGTITLTALEGGGKVTGAHDGISYYYTVIDGARDNFVLSADVKVLAFAKDTPDNQEAFGLMARDAIGSFATSGTQPVFSSNVAAVGGYRGLTNSFMRTGVVNSAGNEGTVMSASSWTTQRPGPSNTYPNTSYRLTLKKNNTGFIASLNDATTTTSLYYAPNNFNNQDSNMYVGFYAARLATIEVSNVSFTVSDAETDAPRVLPPATAVTPSAVVTSLANVSKTEYILQYQPNINGTITVKQGETIIAADVPVTANQVYSKNTVIASGGSTNFTITLTPDASQLLTNYNKLVTNFSVAMKTFNTPDGSIYVSTTGTAGGTGTKEDPLDLDTALQYVKEGQTILLRGGTYSRSTPVIIPMGNDGVASGIKSLKAYPGESVILDFLSVPTSLNAQAGFQLGGDYWHIKGIQVTNSPNTGFLVGGNNNTVELCTVFANKNTGMQISRFTPTLSREFWPSNNLILNCEAYDNRDASENNADGFAAKLTCGEGNVFRGCISRNNIDDGWDLYAKAETGTTGAVTIEGCIAYDNGTLTSGRVGAGDKNGFKLGGEGIAVKHTIRNSIAFRNGAAGFTSNSNPAAQAFDCVSYDNAGGNFVFTTFNSLTPQFVMGNCLSYRSTAGPNDNFPASAANTGNYFWNGTASVNSSGWSLFGSYFASLTPSLPYQRDSNGNIIWGAFLQHVVQSTGDTDSTPTSTPSATPSPTPTVTPAPTVAGKIPSAVVPTPTVDTKGIATVAVQAQTIQGLLSQTQADTQGVRTVGLIVPEVKGATAYNSVLPVSAVNAADLKQKVEIRTALGTVAIPGNMLNNANTGSTDVALSIASVNRNELPASMQSQIGSRPVIELSVTSGGKNISYNNPNAPVTVSIPYKATAEELKDPEHIVVWYIDGAGKAFSVPNARYDAAIGAVVFETTHFSMYAVTVVYKTFDDIGKFGWARNPIEVLASKGILAGTSEKTFAPAANVTRADFTVWLVKALNLTAAVDSNFTDVKSTDGFYREVGIAKKLGIVKGSGNGLFLPESAISRQEMFVITARALKLVKKLSSQGTGSDLTAFRDKGSVAAYAANDIASLVKEGLVKGSANLLNPKGYTTRAEAASFLYRIYNRK